MTDRDGNRSNPYNPNPEMCCEACTFGGRDHATFCSKYVESEYIAPRPAPLPPSFRASILDMELGADGCFSVPAANRASSPLPPISYQLAPYGMSFKTSAELLKDDIRFTANATLRSYMGGGDGI